MAQTIATLDTAHSGPVHDAEVDYYGKRIATAASDNCIKLWDISNSSPFCLAELKGHDAPVWRLCWSHPKYGCVLASCSYDKRVIIWKEIKANDWVIAYKCEEHTASVNAISWCPWEYGLHLASASSDGTVGVLSFNGLTNWTRKAFLAHPNGVNAVSWSPSYPHNNVTSKVQGSTSHSLGVSNGITHLSTGTNASPCNTPYIVSGGCDHQIRIWKLDENHGEWCEIFQLSDNPHMDWVRDVSWRPNVGVPSNTIASCSDDKTLKIWIQSMDGLPWKHSQTITIGCPVFRISWSVTGSVLAVASGDNNVSLFKDTVDGKWEKTTDLDNSHDVMTSKGDNINLSGISDTVLNKSSHLGNKSFTPTYDSENSNVPVTHFNNNMQHVMPQGNSNMYHNNMPVTTHSIPTGQFPMTQSAPPPMNSQIIQPPVGTSNFSQTAGQYMPDSTNFTKQAGNLYYPR